MLYLDNKYKKRRQINHIFLILYNIKNHKFHKYTRILSVLISANQWDLTYSPTNFTNTHGFFPC